jgi:MSHA type pilus biogenesis protein MshL
MNTEHRPPRPPAPGGPRAGALALAAALVLTGCATQPLEERGRVESYRDLREAAAAASERFAEHNDEQRRLLERRAPSEALPQPVMPRYDPLDDVLVSLTMDNEDVRHVLAALARETGMNLALHPELAAAERLLSLQFEQVPASQVFREILRIADLHGEVEGNVMRVTPFQEKIYQVDFIETNLEARFDVGGDVLGTGGGEASEQRLSGNFRLSGTGAAVSNPYVVLENTLGGIIGAEGTLSVNRLAGTVYVRARPSVVRTVDRLLARYREMLERQILLEARIIEVLLTDSYRWGIDWSLVREMVVGGVDTTVGLTQAVTQTIDLAGAVTRQGEPGVTAPDKGLVISNVDEGDATLLALSALENFGSLSILSNPTIRARHGQPAMISVGESNTYVREFTVTVSTGAVDDTVATDVETDTVFDGLLLGVIPFIGDNGRIALAINPIKSDVDRESLELVQIQDTAIALPQVNLKEMSTTIRVRDGDTVILGGLIDSVRGEDTNTLPGARKRGGLGDLFRSENMGQQVRELVIVLRVTQL